MSDLLNDTVLWDDVQRWLTDDEVRDLRDRAARRELDSMDLEHMLGWRDLPPIPDTDLGRDIGEWRRPWTEDEGEDEEQEGDDDEKPVAAGWYVQPWDEPVDGAALLDDLVDYFSGPVVLPNGGAEACALYAVMSWTIELLDLVPYLNPFSATYRSGKTIVGALESWVVRLPVRTANASAAFIFRQMGWPTFVIDEADSFTQLSEELRGILNAGYDRDLKVGRTIPKGRGHEPTNFSPFGPKVICGIGDLPGTIRDRSIGLHMRRKRRSDEVERFDREARQAYRDRADDLRRKIARWIADHWDAIDAQRPDLPDDLNDRQRDCWEPMLMIADVAGGEWPDRARRVARALSADQLAHVDEVELLLLDVQRIFRENRSYFVISNGKTYEFSGHHLTPSELADRLAELEERPWESYRTTGKPITTDALGKLLRGVRVSSKMTRVKRHGRSFRLYWPQLFEEAWERYEVCADCEDLYEVEEP